MDTNKIKEKAAAVRQVEQEWGAIPDGRQAADALHKYTSAVKDLLAELDKASPSSGPYVTVKSRTFPDRLNIVGPTDIGGAMAPALAHDRCRQLNDAYNVGRRSVHVEPKALTDEEIAEMARLHVQAYMTAYSSHDRVHATIAVRELLEKVRNAAPAAGLTVEEVMEMARLSVKINDPEGYDYWRGSPVQSDLRARLTAAMEAKTRKPWSRERK